jgi:hypothetical protein
MAERSDGDGQVGGWLGRWTAAGTGLVFSLATVATLALSWTVHLPRPLQQGGPVTAMDADGDGLEDAEESRLLQRHAPIALLADDEPALPSSVAWVRRRAGLGGERVRFMGIAASPRTFGDEVRRGSARCEDWTVYGHAYRREGGGVVLQYWFYYPFNDAYGWFDHDSDWEHVSVELDPSGEPVWFAAAAHHDNAPGPRTRWDAMRVESGHPVFYVAAGTHASYALREQVPAWERIAEAGRERRWEVGRDGARLVGVGERGRPAPDAEGAFVVGYEGFWGAALPAIGSAAPFGPPFQRSFCVGAARGSCP